MFPVFFQPLWFITAYVFLLFLTPLLNLILSKYEKRKFGAVTTKKSHNAKEMY